MSEFVFTARVIQRKIDHNRALFLAEQIIGSLGDNAVLRDPSITVAPFEEAVALHLRSRVACDNTSKLAVIMAFDASQEQWRDTLAEAGLEHNLGITSLECAE